MACKATGQEGFLALHKEGRWRVETTSSYRLSRSRAGRDLTLAPMRSGGGSRGLVVVHRAGAHRRARRHPASNERLTSPARWQWHLGGS